MPRPIVHRSRVARQSETPWATWLVKLNVDCASKHPRQPACRHGLAPSPWTMFVSTVDALFVQPVLVSPGVAQMFAVGPCKIVGAIATRFGAHVQMTDVQQGAARFAGTAGPRSEWGREAALDVCTCCTESPPLCARPSTRRMEGSPKAKINVGSACKRHAFLQTVEVQARHLWRFLNHRRFRLDDGCQHGDLARAQPQRSSGGKTVFVPPTRMLAEDAVGQIPSVSHHIS